MTFFTFVDSQVGHAIGVVSSSRLVTSKISPQVGSWHR